MPNLPMHVFLAHQVSTRLEWGFLPGHLGSVYLGSTAPDMRAMTRWPRERTHFAPLSSDEVGAGARAMFRRYPKLADRDNLSHATRAFLLGYISHLAGDEVWISDVYRPCFHSGLGEAIIAGDQVEAHIWDRALQLDMDRMALPLVGPLLGAAEAVSCEEVGSQVGFLDGPVLMEWQEWVGRFVARDFTWDRLKRMLNRIYRDDEDVQRAVDGFLTGMPGSLERVYQRVPRARIEAYQRRVVEETLAQAREYWGEG